jgi:hypothetical protein
MLDANDKNDRKLATDLRMEMPDDADRAERIARAERYFSKDLRDQIGWYSRKASGNKSWAQGISFLIITFGASTTLLQIFGKMYYWDAIATAVLGVLIAILQGTLSIWKFDETWHAYRVASERMKRERRLYVNGAGPYSDVDDQQAAYRRFVEAVEQIIAEEQQIYWQERTAFAERCGKAGGAG